MRRSGQRRHIMAKAIAVIDMGEHEYGNILIQCRQHRLRCVNPDQLMCFARQPDQALSDIIVGRKIVAFGQDSAAFATIYSCRPVECCGKQLEQID